MKAELVVTRHPALVMFLIRKGIVFDNVDVLEHATAKQVRGKRVAGILPLHLAAECANFTEVVLNIPFELRGKELSEEEIECYAKNIFTYKITKETKGEIKNG